jgi:hypothetical protein
MTLLWRKGDPLAAALKRLQAILPDPAEGRAPRDAMLPQFGGLDRWMPRPIREALAAAVTSGAITLEPLTLPDGQVTDPRARDHLAGRWTPSSPLYRAACAVVADSEVRPGPRTPDPTPVVSPSGVGGQKHYPHSPCRLGVCVQVICQRPERPYLSVLGALGIGLRRIASGICRPLAAWHRLPGELPVWMDHARGRG